MKKYTLHTTVGIFVIIGLLLVGYMTVKIGEVSILGDDSYSLSARFTSASGLRVGGAVEMLGIEIGQVERLAMDQKDQVAVVELKIRKDIKLFENATASIRTAGLIGEKFINIDAGDSGRVLQPGATITETEPAVEKIPLHKLASQALLAVEGIDRLVRSPELIEAIRSLSKTMNDARILVRSIDNQVVPLASSIEEAMRDTQELVRNVDDQIMPLASSIEETSTAVRAAFGQAEKTLASIEDIAGGRSNLRYVLSETLLEFSAAARSIRVLTDYLEQHPDALLYGKPG